MKYDPAYNMFRILWWIVALLIPAPRLISRIMFSCLRNHHHRRERKPSINRAPQVTRWTQNQVNWKNITISSQKRHTTNFQRKVLKRLNQSFTMEKLKRKDKNSFLFQTILKNLILIIYAYMELSRKLISRNNKSESN